MGARGSCSLPNPAGDFTQAVAECCSPWQLSGCLSVPSVRPRSGACQGFPRFSGIGAVGGCAMRQLLCPSWVRARSCSALVKQSTASRPPDLALSICWKHSLFCPAFVSSQLLVIFHGVFPSDSCAARGCWCKLSIWARACSAEHESVQAGLFRVLPSTRSPK